MVDTDASFQTDLRDSEVQQQTWAENSPVPVRSVLRASNTNETLAPKSIFDNDGVPTIDVDFAPSLPEKYRLGSEEFVKALAEQAKALKPKEVVYGPSKPAEVKKAEPTKVVPKPSVPRFSSIGALVEVPSPFTTPPKSLEERVTKLEGQLDGLLDRIAKYNQRAAHRI